MAYIIKINKRALNDIQKALSHYDKIESSIGDKFLNNLNKTIDAIASNPFFRVRYSDVHCLLIKKVPYMIHFQIKEKRKRWLLEL
jgi:toxin ParE1/3/4